MTTKISVYNLDSSITNAIGSGGGPKIQTIVYPGNDTAVNTAGGDTVFLNGSGFVTGCSVVVNGNTAGSVTFNSSSNVAFTAPAAATGGYPIYLVNPDGGTAIAVPGLQYSGVPTWSTAAGSLGSVYETTAFANTVVATGDAQITYSVLSGSLPTGASLNSLNGTISGNSVATASSTTYNFTIRATDAQQQDSDRAFSLTVNPDVVTWSSPANNVTYTVETNTAISNVSLVATSAAGYGVQYAANTLPTGLTLSGNTISGTPTTAQTVNTLVTATANTTTRTAQQIINWVVNIGSDTYIPYVTTLLSANTAVMPFNDDVSTNNFNVTVNGDTKPNNFNPYQGGNYSAFFDGTGDYLSWSGTTVGTGAFSIECWFYNTGSFTATLFGVTSSGNGKLSVRLFNSTTIRIDRYNTAASSFTVPTMSTGVWYHMVACRNASGASTIFLNGVRSSTGTIADTFNYGAVSSIGILDTTDTQYFTGYISNARIVAGSTPYDPTQSTITVPTSPLTAIANTSLLTCQSNRFIDNSTNNFTITRNGDTKVSSFIPFTPDTSYATYGSTYYDGTGDYLLLPAATSSLYLTGAFTFETWIYPISTGGLIYGNWNNQTGDPWAFFYSAGTFSTGFKIYFYRGNYGSNECALGTTTGLNLNAWNHFAVTRDASNNIYIFLNGVSLGLSTYTAALTWSNSFSFTNSSAIGIGGTPNYASFNGHISNARFINGTALYTSNFTPPTSPLTAVANTQVLTCQTNQPVNNNVFVDESSNNFLVTRNGNATQGTFSPYGENWSNYFDGTGDYLVVSNATAFDQDTNFTVEMWLNVSGYPSTNDAKVYQPNGVGVLAIAVSPAGKINIDDQQTGNRIVSVATLTKGVWYHVALVRNGPTTNNVTLYIDGNADTTVSYSGWQTSPTQTTIGRRTDTSTDYNGYISNLRVVKGTAVYTANFTPSTSPLQPIANTSLLTCQSPGFIDNSPNNFTVTRNGDVSVQKFGPFGQVTLPTPYYSGYFDGTGDFITGTLAYGNGNFTIEAWVYHTASTNGTLCDTRGANPSATGLSIEISGSSRIIQLWSGNGATPLLTSVATVPTNTWTHIAVVRNSGVITIYINGTASGTVSTAQNFSDSTFVIGSNNPRSANFTGYISNLRISNTTAFYTTTFTPSTTPLTAISGTSLLTCQSTTLIDNSSNNLTLTANGDTKPRTFNPFTVSYALRQTYTPSVFGGSMYLDGTGDYLLAPNNAVHDFKNNNFTIECWVYPTTTTATGFISKRADSSTAYGPICVDLSSLTPTILVSTTGSSWTILNGASSTALTLNAWNHFALTRSGSTISMWVNGINTYNSTAVSTSNLATNAASWALGARAADGSGTLFAGYISDFRIINGTTLYTSNFVPSNAPVTAVRNTTLLLNGTTGGINSSVGTLDLETVGDAKLNTAVTKFAGGTSMYFDGTGDYLTAPDNNALRMESGNFTIEFWIYFNSITGYQTPYDKGYTSAGGLLFQTGNGNGRFIIYAAGSAVITETGAASTGTWIHYALVRNGTTLTLYRDGTSSGSATNSTNFNNTGLTVIGANGVGTGTSIGQYPINGYMSDVRITKGIARYTANFTPTTTPFKQF